MNCIRSAVQWEIVNTFLAKEKYGKACHAGNVGHATKISTGFYWYEYLNYSLWSCFLVRPFWEFWTMFIFPEVQFTLRWN
jgi:hypothetical protein